MPNLNDFIGNENIITKVFNYVDKPFISDVEDDFLNLQLKMRYGLRQVYEPYLKQDLETIARLISYEYKQKWLNLKTASKLNVLNSYEKTTLTNDNLKRIGGNGTIQKDSVTSNDSDDLIETNRKDIDNNVNENEDRDLKSTETLINYNQAINNLSAAENLNIINIVLKDISKSLTLDIY